MTDPLLTIDDATREFRASPKTIRRRLVAGEIQGAYKRPGNRGPEWVMPRGSLEAAGFVRRNGAPTTEVPAEPEAQAGYWEQRALDAEAALEVARQGSGNPEGSDRARRRTGAWIGLAAVVVLGLVAVLLVAGRADGPSSTDGLDPSHAATRAILAAATAGEDAIGVVGRVPESLLPEDRRFVLVDADDLDGNDPRYLVAVVAGDPPASWVALRERSDLVATVPVPEGTVELRDRGMAGAREGSEPADPGEAEESTEADAEIDAEAAPAPVEAAPRPSGPEPVEATEDQPEGPDTGAVARQATPDAPPEDGTEAAPLAREPGPAEPPASEPGTIEVTAGDSFWSLAVTLAGSADAAPTTAEVTSVWATLVDANLDRLVEPGNPDLLHVGQILVVPTGSA